MRITQDGYVIKKFLSKKDFDLLKTELEKFVKKHLKSLGIEIDDLTQYHNVVDDDIHYKVYKKLYDNSFFDHTFKNNEIQYQAIKDKYDKLSRNQEDLKKKTELIYLKIREEEGVLERLKNTISELEQNSEIHNKKIEHYLQLL